MSKRDEAADELTKGDNFTLVSKADAMAYIKAGWDAHENYTDGLVLWMTLSLPEMECRADDDCDHCLGVQLLHEHIGDQKDQPSNPQEKEGTTHDS